MSYKNETEFENALIAKLTQLDNQWSREILEYKTEEELIAILSKINKKVCERICDETGVPPILLFQKEKEYLQSLLHHLLLRFQRPSFPYLQIRRSLLLVQ